MVPVPRSLVRVLVRVAPAPAGRVRFATEWARRRWRPGVAGSAVLAGGLVLVVLFGAGSVSTVGGAAGPTAANGVSPDTFAGQEIDPDDTLLQVTLREDGSAAWLVEYRIRLDDENATQAFEDLEEDIQSNPASYREPFAEDMLATAASAENATGREMAIENVTVGTERRRLPAEYGVVVYTFTWRGFANVTHGGDELRAGDALEGLFLTENTTLVFAWPEDYRLVSVEPEPPIRENRSVGWSGKREFLAGQPRVVVSRAGGSTDGGTQPPDGDGDGGDPAFAVPAWIWPVAGLLVAALGVGGVLYARGWRPGEDGVAGGPPQELMSNEEKVLAILEDRDGRVKQQEVAGELDWSDAKTSQVVSRMQDEGRIEVFRIGRENVIRLPDGENGTL